MKTKRRIAGWKAAVMVAAIAVGGCAGTNPQVATEIVEDAGYTNVEITGFDYWGCGTGLENGYLGNKIEMTGFTATAPTGRRVKGTVCKGTWGTYDIRIRR